MKILILLSLLWTSDNKMVPQVYAECVRLGIKHPEIVTVQAIVETGWFKCKDCSYDKANLFGFWDSNKHCYIDYKGDWRKSVADYKKWQDKWYDGKRPYFEFLNCIYKNKKGECKKYAMAEGYISLIRKILDKHFHNWSQ